MISPKENIPYHNFINAVANFNPVLLQNKSYFEIINEGLGIYKEIPGCKSASLFLLNENNFEFYFKASTAGYDDNEIKKIFDELVQDGIIASALSSGKIEEWKINEPKDEIVGYVIIPLIIPTGIYGLNILILEQPLSKLTHYITAFQIFANYFAQLLNTFDLNKEIEDLKKTTEQKIALRTNDIVQGSRELKAILDSVQIGIIIVNKSTNQIEDVNMAAAEMIGTAKEKIVGTNKEKHFIITEAKSSLTDIVTNKEGLLKSNNGSVVPIIITESMIRLGQQNYSIESFMDISERKNLEDELYKAHFELEHRVEQRTFELSKANQKLHEEIQERIKIENEKLKLFSAVQQSPISIAITDLDGKIEYVNPQFSEMTGYKSEEVLGKDSFFLKSENNPSEELKSIRESLNKGEKWHGDLKNKGLNGNVFWVSSFISPMANIQNQITNYLEIEEDINDKKQAEFAIITAKEKAEESNKLKSRLLANISHEFRTPLIGILGFSQILMNEIKNPVLVGFINDIFLSGKRLMNTLSGILNLAQLENRELSSNLDVINLAERIEKSIAIYRDIAKGKLLELNVEIIRKQLFVNIDLTLFDQALGYLVDNAIKFTNKGSITIIADVFDNGEKWAAIKIKDTGIGIAEEDQQSIFDAFRQVSEGYNRNYEGMGLGLTLAQRIIKLMNGSITIESTLHKGSTFTILLPLVEKYKP